MALHRYHSSGQERYGDENVSIVWRHVKTGGVYVIVDEECMLESDLTPMVAYMSLKDGQVWLRPRGEFFDGRFVKLE